MGQWVTSRKDLLSLKWWRELRGDKAVNLCMSVKWVGPAVVDRFGTFSSEKGDERLFTDYLQTLVESAEGSDPSRRFRIYRQCALNNHHQKKFGSSALTYLTTKLTRKSLRDRLL